MAGRPRHRLPGVDRTARSQLTDVILKGNFDAFQWGWYVEPDPDSMLSYLTCGQRGGWSDSWYCNKAVRHALRRSSTCETDHAKRVAERQEDAADPLPATRRTW